MTFHGALYDGKLNSVAQDDRQAAVGWAQGPGVFTANDLLCSAGAGMASNMAAGRGLVANTFASQGGLWIVRNDASVATPSHAANASGNPRIDAVGPRVFDSETGGDSSDITSPIVISGTATVGATLANLTGAPGQSGGPALQNNFLVVAYVLVPNGAASSASFSYLNFASIVGPTLQMVAPGASVTARCGQCIVAAPSTTVTLPSPLANPNAMVAVQANASVTGATPVTVSGTLIQGLGLTNAASFLLGAPGASVALQSDGTNWRIVSGRQDTGWVNLSLGTGMATHGSETPGGRLVGDRVFLRGAIDQSSGSAATLGTLPASMKPAVNVLFPGTMFQSPNYFATFFQVASATGILGSLNSGTAPISFYFGGCSYVIN